MKASDLTHQVTIEITGVRVMEFRFWLAAFIFRLGAKVAGVGVEINGPKDEDAP